MTLDKRLSWSIFALLFFSYAYFNQAGGWNENTRFDLVRAIVDDHTLSIDRYHENTGDKARVGDHYYSDKAPGLSFAAVPVYAAFRMFRGLFATEHAFVVIASYVVTALTIGVAGAALGMLIYRAGRRLGATPEGAALAALGYGLGTTAFPLSTMFFGHQLAALALFLAFYVALCRDESSGKWTSALVVLIAATAVLVEFPTAPAAFLVVLYDTRGRLSRRSWVALAAAIVPVSVLGLYLAHAFGSPGRVGYDALSDPASRAEMHSHGIFGVTYPKVGVLVELLLGRYRGLLPYSPVLFLAIPGFLGAFLSPIDEAGATDDDPNSRTSTALDDHSRHAIVLAGGVVAYFLLFISSYEWWQGGSSFGSRHLAPMLPFLMLPVALAATRRPGVALALVLPAIAVMTIVTAVQPKPSDSIMDPFWSRLVPAFFHGHLSANNVCPFSGTILKSTPHTPIIHTAQYDAFNLGMLLGGRGLKSLVPLVAIWATSFWAIRRTLRADQVEGGPRGSANDANDAAEAAHRA
jgi:hypothetical protein